MDKNESKPAGDIYRLIPEVMRGIGAVGKDRKNEQQNYKFRGIDDFYNAVHGPLSAAGVFVVPTVLTVDREERTTKHGGAMFYARMTVKHTFFAPDGSFIEAVTAGEAMDTGDKASNKAMSAAMKYALIEVFAIPTHEDNDTENHSPEVEPKKSASRNQPAPAPRTSSTANAPKKATPEQVQELRGFVAAGDVTKETVKKWFDYAKVTEFAALSEDQAAKCIRSVRGKKQIAAEQAA